VPLGAEGEGHDQQSGEDVHADLDQHGRVQQGVVISVAEFEKVTKSKWDKVGSADSTPVR